MEFNMKNFEERLARLEVLGEHIRKSDTSLDTALKDFEEGVKLARSLEKDLEKVESRVEILLNGPEESSVNGSKAEMGLFDGDD
jgi:exodeoxyribonuclease VII small subunit